MISEEELKLLQGSIGTHSRERPLCPIEAGALIKKGAVSHSDFKELASKLGITDTTVLRSLVSLLSLPDEIKVLIIWGNKPGCISFSVAAQLSTLAREKDQTDLAQIILEKRLSKTRVREILRKFRSHTPASILECV